MESEVIQFQIKDLLGIGMTIVILGIAMGYGIQVMATAKNEMGDDNCAGYWNSASNVCQVNSTNTTKLADNDAATTGGINAITGVAKIPEKLPTIVTVIIAAVIISVLVTYLWARFR